MADAESSAQGATPESTPGFTDGYKAGYLSAWAAAVFRVLDTRGVETSKEFDRGLSMLRDATALTLCLERAVTASHVRDLFAGSPRPDEASA
ncbi:hypothetical protein [Streptomyces sp. NPDC018693]|uniref:hypothetical protein n=1 Tax=unclassified Streptomyces TaxID=2593676 RepID=UPI00378EB75F